MEKGEEEEGTSWKDLLIDENSNFPAIFFRIPFEQATKEQQLVWKWIVMELLPIVSFDWKVRVTAGRGGKVNSETMLDIVTTSDLAFTYALLEWAARKKWKGKINGSGSSTASSSESDGDSVPASIENKVIKRGRKKGEEGFASKANIRRFNRHGEALVNLRNETGGGATNRESWNSAAMKYVNKESEDDLLDMEGMALVEHENDDRVVPFVEPEKKRTIIVAL